MNTALMTQIQTLIYSNQDKLEQLVEALESVCELGNTIVAPTSKHPLLDYVVSEKDIGSMFTISNISVDRLDDINGLQVNMKDCGRYFCDDITPYTDTIKLHFKPFIATKDSEMPDGLGDTGWIALLFNCGDIVVTEYPAVHDWASNDGNNGVIIGYQILSFVNPVLEK